ncbi:hypothetical protein P1P68_03315 [Streptomyces scabiei]|uniref:hypothetical protein n=1 Tax=Streptomyces scabiei TaxID=1930 RepID=UPI0029906029|nr:hypothetical protein [Streptomyces scabiei]MDW8803842.1 hypothetical protein [Streptomyces scabiei]
MPGSVVLWEEPYDPFGGLPEEIRAGCGKDFLSWTVTAAFDLLDVTVEGLPASTSRHTGTVEGLDRAAEGMFLAALPRLRPPSAPRQTSCPSKDEVLRGFEEARVLHGGTRAMRHRSHAV